MPPTAICGFDRLRVHYLGTTLMHITVKTMSHFYRNSTRVAADDGDQALSCDRYRSGVLEAPIDPSEAHAPAGRYHSQPLQKELIDLNSMLVRVAELCRYNPQMKGVEIELTLDEIPCVVNLERSLLELALNRLVSNALSAMADQKPPKRLRLTAHRAGEMAQITVEDSGRSDLLTDWVRSGEQSWASWSALRAAGVGLSMAHRLIVAQGGRMVCQASALGGMSVAVLLPVRRESVQRKVGFSAVQFGHGRG